MEDSFNFQTYPHHTLDSIFYQKELEQNLGFHITR